tara:strand:- start:478 stop:744 length:267 start_codon:yes stop_codon:yes gene_type:complete
MTTAFDYSISAILSFVDGAQLVRVMGDRYLYVWYGGTHVDVWDLIDSEAESDAILTPMFGALAHALIFDLIEDHFATENEDDQIPRKT